VKYVNIAKLILVLTFCFCNFLLAEEIIEFNVTKEAFEDFKFDIKKMKEVLPPRLNSNQLTGKLFVDVDNDNVDDFIENIVQENAVEDVKIIKSLNESLYLARKAYNYCSEKNEKLCFIFSKLESSYTYNCSKFRKEKVFDLLRKRYRLYKPQTDQVGYYRKLRRKYKKIKTLNWVKDLDKVSTCSNI
jgi:hypothetical protein